MAIYRSFNKRKPWVNLSILVGFAVLLAACSSPAETLIQCPEVESLEVECPETACPEQISFEELWITSGHADSKSEAFTHWDEDNPKEVPSDCAKCHSRPGFIDYLGVDGSLAGRVDNAAQIGTTITCFVCHNEQTMIMDSVVFPSRVRLTKLGSSSICMQCHQGLSSAIDVNEATTSMDADVVYETLEFISVHYSAAGATIFGTEVKGAYEYDGMSYRDRFLRAEELFSCTRCHDQHSLTVDIEKCGECHTSGGDDLRSVRVDTTDYDGDGDIEEGIAFEIEAIHEALYKELITYANDVIGVAIAYDPGIYPYFFIDTNSNGSVDPEEAQDDNSYTAWTPRLLKAAYNYQFVAKDPGAFAHHPDYVIQILYDSLADIGGDVSRLHRPQPNGK
jgi:hypothetical protein